MIIPFAEYCMACDLGEPGDYEYYHPPSVRQMENLLHHVDCRDNLYLFEINRFILRQRGTAK